MNILLIEDEVNVAGFIQKGLEDLQHKVAVAYDGINGVKLATEQNFDLIVLDVILPNWNGWEVCRKLRTDLKMTTPILMLTALSSTEHVIKGLNDGADDYLAKPFKMEELIARLQALHRRHRGLVAEKKSLTFADLVIDLDACEVARAGMVIQLTSREFKLLTYFVENSGKVLSRMQIMQHVWGVDFDLGTNVVDVYVNYLRKKIDKNFERKLIHTVVGMGYILK